MPSLLALITTLSTRLVMTDVMCELLFSTLLINETEAEFNMSNMRPRNLTTIECHGMSFQFSLWLESMVTRKVLERIQMWSCRVDFKSIIFLVCLGESVKGLKMDWYECILTSNFFISVPSVSLDSGRSCHKLTFHVPCDVWCVTHERFASQRNRWQNKEWINKNDPNSTP
jgi:hypothetical protein